MFSTERSKIAVVLENPVKKQRINKNVLRVKGETKKLTNLQGPPKYIERSQVPFEMVKEPKYRIYFSIDSTDVEKEAAEIIEGEKSVYTPFLGISELLADYSFLGTWTLEPNEGTVQIDSVVNVDRFDPIFERGKKYGRENMAMAMNEDREVQIFANVMYEETGGSIQVQDASYYDVGDDKVTFLVG